MSQVYLTRLVVETQSPMAINTGNREVGFDTQLARDVNSLPYIPATSIAGVWRNIARETMTTQEIECWFGFAGNKSQSSTLTIADGALHNNKNKPVQGFLTPELINQDEILSLLIQERPHLRERVSINDRGVAKDKAKFDQIILPAGVRFCIDVKFNFDNANKEINEEQWQKLLACWQHPQFAFGSSTRNGLGKIKVIASKQQIIELDNNPKASEEISLFAKRENIPTSLDITPVNTFKHFASLPLKAIDNWRCGSGSQLLTKNNIKNDHSINIITYSESKFHWTNNKVSLSEPEPVLCGSSIKGIIAHRLAYHLRRHNNIWAEDMSDANHEEWETRPEALKGLLGIAHEEHAQSLAGKLFVEDSTISYKHTITRHHNSIDRFTGGVRKGALYSEELLYQPEFTLKISLASNTSLPLALIKALEDTFEDLKIGLLPMGAGSGRGTSLVMSNPQQSWDIDFSQIQEEISKEGEVA
jgi:CRISPR/Cas system CMR subunit Cmr4 (Cas7 group RAMP superfamily)